jgi:acyl-CoA thioesterase-1
VSRFARISAAALLAALLAAPSPGQAATAETATCVTPASLALTKISLPGARSEIRANKALVVLALGSAPTLGTAADGAAFSYPSRLELHLAALLPGVEVSVVNKGAARRSTHGMTEHLPGLLETTKARVVIWETGGREVARGMDVDSYASDLQLGLDSISAAGADAILLDLQYAPDMPHIVPFDAYRQAIHDAAANAGVPVLERYDLMVDWAQHGLDLSAVDPEKRVVVARRLFDCMASTLALAIARAVR